MNKREIGWRIAYLVAAGGVYMTDQVSKAWAVRHLRLGTVKELIPGFMALVYAENTGIAFGQLQEGGSFGRWSLTVLAGLAALAVLYYFWRTPRREDRVLGACALLLAGILGNLTDRVRLSFVVDFILVHVGDYHWPVFNVADASICVGAILLAYDLFFHRRKEAKNGKQPSPQAE